MNQEEKQLQELRLRENAFTRHNFFELETVERDRAVYRLDIRDESKNPYGMVHGGALYTLAADAAGAAVPTGVAACTDGRHYVTQNGSRHFLKNQPGGTIRAEGRVRRRGKATCLAVVDITNEAGELLATGGFSYFCIDQD